MCFCFTKTLAGGAIPRTPSTTSAPERGTARTSFVLGSPMAPLPVGVGRVSASRGNARPPAGR